MGYKQCCVQVNSLNLVSLLKYIYQQITLHILYLINIHGNAHIQFIFLTPTNEPPSGSGTMLEFTFHRQSI